MKSISLDSNVKKEVLLKYKAIGTASPYNFKSKNGRDLKGYVLKTFTSEEENRSLFLYLFPGQGGNEEWVDENDGFITHVVYNECKETSGNDYSYAVFILWLWI